jgi:LPXTG-site transpeptidase (sortase) family protein
VVKRHWPLAALASGLLLLAAGGIVAGAAVVAAHPAAAAPPARIIPEGVFPSPSPVAQPVSHDGFRVRMPALGIDLPVVEGDGLTAPLNQAAHYPGMKWPGDGGRSLLYAHGRVGMFGPLFRAHVGQEIDVDRPGESTLRYSIREYDARWPATDVSVLGGADHEQLVLLTCTTYNPADPRIVVFAEPIS